MAEKQRVTAALWWQYARHAFNAQLIEMITKAKKAEVRDLGHECGHEFTFSIVMRGHSSGISCDPKATHSDADCLATFGSITVRAHNLRDALLVAACRPFTDWTDDGDPTDPDPTGSTGSSFSDGPADSHPGTQEDA